MASAQQSRAELRMRGASVPSRVDQCWGGLFAEHECVLKIIECYAYVIRVISMVIVYNQVISVTIRIHCRSANSHHITCRTLARRSIRCFYKK